MIRKADSRFDNAACRKRVDNRQDFLQPVDFKQPCGLTIEACQTNIAFALQKVSSNKNQPSKARRGRFGDTCHVDDDHSRLARGREVRQPGSFVVTKPCRGANYDGFRGYHSESLLRATAATAAPPQIAQSKG